MPSSVLREWRPGTRRPPSARCGVAVAAYRADSGPPGDRVRRARRCHAYAETVIERIRALFGPLIVILLVPGGITASAAAIPAS